MCEDVAWAEQAEGAASRLSDEQAVEEQGSGKLPVAVWQEEELAMMLSR
jgi:hypothetical protein